MPLDKTLDAVTEADLRSLIENQVPEGKTLDYKQELPGGNDEEKREFLSDVCSFANTAGGDLIYGVREDNGLPVELMGVDLGDEEKVSLQLLSSIRDGISPRIAGVQLRSIPLVNGKAVLILRIPQSFASPHMITFKGGSRFWGRTGSGKYQLDVHEIRIAFLLSEAITERIRTFRTERLTKIVSGQTTFPLQDWPKIVLHVVPLSAFREPARLSADALAAVPKLVTPIYETGTSHNRYTLEGYIKANVSEATFKADSYVEVYRSGIIESVDASLLKEREHTVRRFIPSLKFEKDILTAVIQYLNALKQLGLAPPLFVLLSILGAKGYVMPERAFGGWYETLQIDRDTLLVPEVRIESFDVEISTVLKPLFDAVWNAAGRPGSPHYDGDKWVGEKPR